MVLHHVVQAQQKHLVLVTQMLCHLPYHCHGVVVGLMDVQDAHWWGCWWMLLHGLPSGVLITTALVWPLHPMGVGCQTAMHRLHQGLHAIVMLRDAGMWVACMLLDAHAAVTLVDLQLRYLLDRVAVLQLMAWAPTRPPHQTMRLDLQMLLECASTIRLLYVVCVLLHVLHDVMSVMIWGGHVGECGWTCVLGCRHN